MKNLILLAMSTLPYSIKPVDYITPENGLIKGCVSQLEPATRYFLSKCAENDEAVIISLATSASLHDSCYYDLNNFLKINDGEKNAEHIYHIANAQDFFVSQIRKSTEGKRLKLTFTCIDDFSEGHPEKSIKEAVDYIRQNRGRLFLVTNGGFRDVSLVLNAILFLLKREGILPSDICGTDTTNRLVKRQVDAFQILEFVSGMDTFLEFGNVDILKSFYKKRGEDDKISDLLNAMELISQGTQLCDPLTYAQGLDELISYVDKFQREKKLDDALLNIYIDNILRDYGKDLLDKEKEEDRTVNIIKRCIDKKLYQQALTFIESAMPTYLFNNEILHFDNTTKNNNIIEKAKNDRHMRYVNNVNFVFDAYVTKIRYTYGKEANINDIVTYYAKGVSSRSDWRNDFILTKDISLNRGDSDAKIQIKTILQNDNLKKRAGEMVRMHKVIKELRNMFNHGASDTINNRTKKRESRPQIDYIVLLMKNYINTAEKLVKEVSQVKKEIKEYAEFKRHQ